jgi:LCP family protein required for cell wall assembly
MTDDDLPTTDGSGGPAAATVDPETEPKPDTETSPDSPKPGRRKKQKGFIRRHRMLIAIGVLLALIAGSAGGYYWYLNHQLSSIDRVDSGITTDPGKEGGGEQNQPLNILLLGADNGQDTETVAEDLADGNWTPFLHRSDTLMIAHVSADRSSVQLISIPRDTWVPIDGYPYDDGHGKINAAFAYGGPSLAVKTVQNLSGMHIDHMAIIDWAGFKDLTTALGGVRVYIPETFYDESQRITWTQGWHDFEGQEALAYVRTRHGLENGDFDRIERQQNFMRATMQKLLSEMHGIGAGFALPKVLNSITKYLTIDNTWSNEEIKNLALSLRSIHASDVQFLTAPLGTYDTVDGQSIVRLAPNQSDRLFDDVDNDNLDDYLERYPDADLGGDRQIN